jgi:hypothetical protein
MTIVNYTSSSVNKLKALHTHNARVIIYDRHVFIVQATGGSDNRGKHSSLLPAKNVSLQQVLQKYGRLSIKPVFSNWKHFFSKTFFQIKTNLKAVINSVPYYSKTSFLV